MLILSVDASLPLFSIAVTRGSEQVAAYAAEGKGSRNEKLLASVDWILAEISIDRSELDLLVVTRGPGSFTGVRVGLATIEGMAFAIDRPICALSTHEAAIGSRVDEVLVWSDAGRGESYVAAFREGNEWVAPSLAGEAELESLRSRIGTHIRIEELISTSNLALLGARRAFALHQRGRMEGRSDTTPIYVRLAEAEVKLQQRLHD
ncbi:MAG: tRNA (adenosine(37)-N6)-threonylcarbamoyltransferase complex dimerization subunit type 1 TsaB [Thermoanaerobaculia bacterium]